MNIGARWTVLTLTVTLSALLTGCSGAGSPAATAQPSAAKAASAVKAQVLIDTEGIAVDILAVSYSLTAFAEDKSPATRAVKLKIAKAHTESARAAAGAISDKSLLAIGSTAQVRENITRTLKVLSAEVDVTIACEKEQKPSCGNAATVARQNQAGQAAGAAVVQLMSAAKVEQKFVAAAANVVQQDMSVAGVTTLDTVSVRKRAIILAPGIKLNPQPAAGPNTAPAPKATAKVTAKPTK
ncbi:MAG: hypothetical protein ACOH1Y_14865 [Propionicimonas sp.]